MTDRIKETYRKAADEGGPSPDDVKHALGTLASAWTQVADSVTSALQDPEVRTRIKEAASSFAAAMGTTISDLGQELRRDAATEEEE